MLKVSWLGRRRFRHRAAAGMTDAGYAAGGIFLSLTSSTLFRTENDLPLFRRPPPVERRLSTTSAIRRQRNFEYSPSSSLVSRGGTCWFPVVRNGAECSRCGFVNRRNGHYPLRPARHVGLETGWWQY